MALLQENKHSYLDVVGVVRNSCKANYDKNVAYYLLKKASNFFRLDNISLLGCMERKYCFKSKELK